MIGHHDDYILQMLLGIKHPLNAWVTFTEDWRSEGTQLGGQWWDHYSKNKKTNREEEVEGGRSKA